MSALLSLLVLGAAAAAPAAPSARCTSDGALVFELDGLTFLAHGDGLALLEVAAPAPAAAAVGPLTVVAGDPAIVAQGAELRRCPSQGRCTTVARLAGEVRGVAPDARGFWFALGGSASGLYRAPVSLPGAAQVLVAATVGAFCPRPEGGVWAALSRQGTHRLALLDASAPTLSFFDLDALYLTAPRRQLPLETWQKVLASARARAPASLEPLALIAADDERAEVRRLAIPELVRGRGRARAALFSLAQDTDAGVRRDTFAAVAQRCRAEWQDDCAGLASMFLGDTDLDLAWGARDLLLPHLPRQALTGAPSRYKLDAAAQLTLRLERDGFAAVRDAVLLLAADSDAEVRQAARLLMGSFEH